MPYVIGTTLALLVGVFATVVRLDRERAFYTVVAIVVATYYALFAVMGGRDALVAEVLVGLGFIALATWGFRSSLWIVVAALAGHGAFDLVHGAFINNRGLPAFWPPFCMMYDVAAAGYLAVLLARGRLRAAA